MTNSPTFIARFTDGTVTKMTTFTLRDPLDVGRGVRLARHAYRARKKLKPATATPAIVEARYVEPQDGSTLATYDADTLATISD